MIVGGHQEIRVLSVQDTIDTLAKLQERLKKDVTSVKSKKRVKGVESLSVTLALVADTASPDLIVNMCQAVARCFPKLKSFQLSSELEYDSSDEQSDPALVNTTTTPLYIPIQALTALFHPHKGLKKLKELTLDGLAFSCQDESMRILCKAISRQQALQRCYLYDTRMTTLPKSGRSGMEKFVAAIGKKVQKLVIVGCKLAATPKGVWAGSCLVKLCRSTTLQELKLHNLKELREEHIVLMSQELSSNTSLKKLSILKTQELAELGELKDSQKDKKVSNNHKKNNKKRLSFELSSDAGTLAMANMLRENTSLEEICLSAVDFNEYSAMFLGNALEESNSTLRELWLMIPAHNGGTSSFPVDDPRIDYYLRLNRAGRFRVVQQQQETDGAVSDGATIAAQDRKFWVNTLALSKRDIDCSFYLLRNMPALCDVSNNTISS